MKKRWSVFVVSLFILGLGQVSISSAAPTNIAIKFDGYCDGMAIVYDTSTGYAFGKQTGCASDPFQGVVANVMGQGPAFALAIGVGADAAGLTFVIRANKSWTIVGSDGTKLIKVNEGTWTPGSP